MHQLGLEYRAAAGGKSQCDLILAELAAQPGAWVPMPELYRRSGSLNVHSRISDLRKRGFHVEQGQRRAADGTNLSFYRLVEKELWEA